MTAPTGSSADAATAAALAAEVHAEPGGRMWRRVTNLLDDFDEYRLTPGARKRIAAALDGAASARSPASSTPTRTRRCAYSIEAEDRGSTLDGIAATEMIRVLEWPACAAPREIDLRTAQRSPDVVWIDLDVATIDPADAVAAVELICGPRSAGT